MKRRSHYGTAASVLCVALLATVTTAVAQETRTQPTPDDYSSSISQPDDAARPTAESLMKKCVQRERAGNSTLSESEAKQTCQEAMRAKRENHDNEPQPHPLP